MGIIVQKFGGSSVADAERIRRVALRAIETQKQGNDVVVVVSAMGDTTDELITLMNELSSSPSDREVDMLLSTGEQVSIALLAMTIEELGYSAISLTGPQAGIMTEDVHLKAKIIEVKPDRVLEELKKGKIVVVAGFQGINSNGDITTLGRGGSDTTAVALAAALNSEVCEIFTDVDGVYTANPRLVPDAKKLSVISYDEMLEMASLGAQVLQSRAVEFAKHYGVKIHVRASFNNSEGTIVREERNMEKGTVVTGVTYDKNVAKFAILGVPDTPGIAHKIFSALGDARINVDVIVQGAKSNEVTDILFTVAQTDIKKSRTILEKICLEIGATGILCEEDVAKVSIVGAGMASNPGVAGRMFGALAKVGVNIEAVSTSEIKISCLIKQDSTEKAVKAIHEEFGLGK